MFLSLSEVAKNKCSVQYLFKINKNTNTKKAQIPINKPKK